MKQTVRLTVVVLLASLLFPVQPAHGTGVIVGLFDGEAHLTTHRCNAFDKTLGVPSTCGSIKNRPSTFTFGASEVKAPKKDGNITRCYAVKTANPVAAKPWGGLPLGPFCDILVAGVTGKKDVPVVGGDSPLGTCENSEGAFAGILAVYGTHGGTFPKKDLAVMGAFEVKFGFGILDGFGMKVAKPQAGPFMGMFNVSPQGLTKGTTDTIDDCYLAIVSGKDDPQQVRVTGFFVGIQT